MIERERSPEFNVVDLAGRSLDIYLSHDVGEREGFGAHAARTAMLVRSVAGDLVPQEVVAATLLHDVADRLHNKESSKNNPRREAAAREALEEFFTNPGLSNESGEYITCLLADMIKVEKDSGEHRIKMASKSKNCNGDDILPEAVKMISEHYDGKIPSEVWRRVEPLLEFDPMRRFMKGVNLESLIIKSCELVDNMKYPSSKRESAWLQDVLEAESYYAPMMEVLGLDGLASMLRGEAHILRLEGQGRQDLIDRARKINSDIMRVGIQNIATEILGGKSAILQSAVGGMGGGSDRPVQLGEFAVETGDGRLMSGNYRLKTDGSLANKMNGKYDGKVPMDLLGLTVISKDLETSADDFASFIAERLPEFEAKPARGKEKAIYVRGGAKYIEQIKFALTDRGVDHSICQFKEDEAELIDIRGYEDYRVSKVTFIANKDGVEVPTEVQFVTKQERKRARLGEVSHLIYKYLKSLEEFPEEKLMRERELAPDELIALEIKRAERNGPIVDAAMETLEHCYGRKGNMRPYNLAVNHRSVARGDKLLRDVVA